jgi:hypothetical protein
MRHRKCCQSLCDRPAVNLMPVEFAHALKHAHSPIILLRYGTYLKKYKAKQIVTLCSAVCVER